MRYNNEMYHVSFYIFYLDDEKIGNTITALYDKMTIVSEANETLSFMEPINEDKVMSSSRLWHRIILEQ